MKYYKKLVGDNIYLSPVRVEDVEIYLKWMNDKSVTDGIHGGARVNNIVGEEKWLQKTLENGDYTFGIILNDKLIGNCGIMDVNNIDGTAEVGIFIGDKSNRGKGYGTEAIKLLVDYGFKQLRLHNICLNVFSFNEIAINCYKDIGFSECGRRHECYYLDGKYYDTITMEILVDDYLKEG